MQVSSSLEERTDREEVLDQRRNESSLVKYMGTTLRTDWQYRWRNPTLPQPQQAELSLEYAGLQRRAISSSCQDHQCALVGWATNREALWDVVFPFSLAFLMQKEVTGAVCLHLLWLNLSTKTCSWMLNKSCFPVFIWKEQFSQE